MMGRRQQPAAIKEAKGNPGRRPIAKEGPATPASAVAAPKDLKAGPRRVWERLAPELAGMRILKPSDFTAFRRYCVFVHKWGQLEPLLDRAELVVTTISAHNPDGLERKSQALLAALMLDKRLSEIEDRFGMNPAARQRLVPRHVGGRRAAVAADPRRRGEARGRDRQAAAAERAGAGVPGRPAEM
jgi:P27 family predicted phage terminase small subunit